MAKAGGWKREGKIKEVMAGGAVIRQFLVFEFLDGWEVKSVLKSDHSAVEIVNFKYCFYFSTGRGRFILFLFQSR